MDQEQAAIVRGLVSRGVVRSTSDSGQTQSATVTTHRHVDRSDVEIMQPFGFSSNPGKGAGIILLSVGGDQGDLIGLPMANRSQRLGNLKPGEAAMYGADGTRVHVKDDGTIHVPAREGLKVEAGPFTIEISKTGDRMVLKRGDNRVVLRPGYVKMRAGGQYMVVTPGSIIVSSAPVIGADPEPGL